MNFPNPQICFVKNMYTPFSLNFSISLLSIRYTVLRLDAAWRVNEHKSPTFAHFKFFWKWIFFRFAKVGKIYNCCVHTWCDLHMLWMVADAIDQLVGLQFANADIMDGCEQWESKRRVGRNGEFNSGWFIPFVVRGVIFTWLPFLCFSA